MWYVLGAFAGLVVIMGLVLRIMEAEQNQFEDERY